MSIPVMNERVYQIARGHQEETLSDPHWRKGEQGRVTVETIKDVRVGIGTPGETVIPKGERLRGGFSARDSVIVQFDPRDVPDLVPGDVGVVHLWHDEYKFVVGDGEMVIANNMTVDTVTTNGEEFEAGPGCIWIAIALGDGRVLARIEPMDDGDGGFFDLDSFTMERGEWSLVFMVEDGIDVFVRGLAGVQE